ncbi:MAG: argininosuccinate lyase [Clostridiales Family XIII bacterium]|jgi:argininosuccinate lyase|nr:argininosuccinate lyase [Clostridiales Family XIII bacterium]
MKLWNGRFSKDMSGVAEAWAASVEFDKRLYREDIAGSIAHCRMLVKQNIISEADASLIEAGLHGILNDIEAGSVTFTPETEDIHMSIEALLTERIGEAGKRLHTARSRNDQVATDTRLYLKEEILHTVGAIKKLCDLLLTLAESHTETVMPGYTHLQHAQPVSFAFHLMAYYNMFGRDAERFWNCYERTDYLPLGAGALSGVGYDTDRAFLADELDFAHICDNAMDAVSDRDFLIEYISSASICMMHLSRFCEELILWSSAEFAFIEQDDAYSTGSSIMPQKKNPDIAELIRGKTGRVYGDLITILTVMKGLPLAYNKDMQEDKLPLFDAVDTLKGCLAIFTEMLASVKVRKDRMAEAAKTGFMNATDAADYLAAKGVPFRECHEIIGKLVLHCIEKNTVIEDLTLTELQTFSDKFAQDIHEKLTPLACMNAKQSEGSTAVRRVKEQIERAKSAKRR